jgi:transcriptional regulator NrdR family protein
MKCPRCGTDGQVLETRVRPDGMRRRRYECAKQHRFSTLEFIAEPMAGIHGQPLQAKYTPEKAPCN